MTNRKWLESLSDKHFAEILSRPTLEKGIRDAALFAANEWEFFLNIEEWLKAEREE